MPLVLSIGMITTTSLMGAIYVAMNSNQRTRYDYLRFLGRTSLDSLRTQYKSLLNDSDGGNIYNYFLVADGCSTNTPSQECPIRVSPGVLENPSTAVWVDGVWKHGAGRQKGPMCKPNTNQALDWASPHRAIQTTFFQQGIDLNPGVEPSATGFVHSYTSNEIITTGTTKQQLVSLIGGKGGKINKAGRTAMINLQVARTMNKNGFAFISAGYNGSERMPITLSNLKTSNSNNGISTGTILLRKNIYTKNECSGQIRRFHTTYNRSPIAGNSQYGGLTIFPAKFPTDLGSHSASKGTTINKGTLILRKGENNSTQNRIGPGGIYEFDDLYLLPGSKLDVDTSKPVTLKIRGDIHIAAGAKICNVRTFGQSCGSGKASQLTIIQGSTAEATSEVSEKIQCDMNLRDTYLLTGEAEPVSVGGRTMTIQGTGTSNESLSAFIYAPSSTVISAGVAKSWNNSGRYQWVQQHGAKHTHSVIQKGGYLHLAIRNSSTNASLYELRDEKNRPIKVKNAKLDQQHYTGAGKLQTNTIPSNAITNSVYTPDPNKIYTPENIIMRHNLRIGAITIHGVSINSRDMTAKIEPTRSIQYQQGQQIIDFMSTKLSETQINSGKRNELSNKYNIELMSLWDNADIANASRRFKGAVWGRNVCFSREDTNFNYRKDWINKSTPHIWEFDNTFVDEIVDRYGQEYNFGLHEYRAMNEILVDPQRVLSK